MSAKYRHKWVIEVQADSPEGAMDAIWECWEAWHRGAEPISGFVPERMGRRMEYAVRKMQGSSEEDEGPVTEHSDMRTENVGGCELMGGCRLVCLHHAPLLAEPCRRCPRRVSGAAADGKGGA